MLHEHMARVGQNRSRSLKWAEKQENFQPMEMCFFLTSTFIELIRLWSRAWVLMRKNILVGSVEF